MTIEEHILRAEEDAKIAESNAEWSMINCFVNRVEAAEYAKECRDLVNCLKDYKRLLEQKPKTLYCPQCGAKIAEAQERENEEDKVPFDFELYEAGLMDMPKGMIEVLDKIRVEIEQRPYGVANDSVIQGIKYERMVVLEIIDKYKAESEE